MERTELDSPMRIEDELDKIALVLDGMGCALGRVSEQDPFADVEGQAAYVVLDVLAARVRDTSEAVRRICRSQQPPTEAPTDSQ